MARPFPVISFFLLAASAWLGACSRQSPAADAKEPEFSREHPRHITFQTDWFPQAEHGGFYQALAKGYYREVGLDVTLLPGGPGSNIKLSVARGDADLGMNRSDNLIVAAAKENLPLVMVATVTQHDHQALLVHAASPVRTFADLQNRTLIASPGQAWIIFLQKRYGIRFNQIPNRGGLAAFLADPDVIQQCLVTNEPFLAQEKGVPVRTLMLADAGYDIYTAIFCRREFARNSPAAIRAFVAASLRGWRDYIAGDPALAHAAILKANPNESQALLEFSRNELIKRRIVAGNTSQGEFPGRMDVSRIRDQINTLVELGILEGNVPVGSVMAREFLPPEAR